MAKTSFLLVIALVWLALTLSACENRSQNNFGKYENARTGTHEPLSNKTEPIQASPRLPEGLTELVDSADTLDPDRKREAIERIEDIAKSDPAKGKEIIEKLTADIQEICVDHHYSESLFPKVKTMPMILSDLGSIEALDVLIDCSTNTPQVASHVYGDGVTVPAIVSYKNKALPALEKRLRRPVGNVDDEILKCTIATIPSRIGSKEAKQTLIDASQNETDKEALSCMNVSLSRFQNQK